MHPQRSGARRLVKGIEAWRDGRNLGAAAGVPTSSWPAYADEIYARAITRTDGECRQRLRDKFAHETTPPALGCFQARAITIHKCGTNNVEDFVVGYKVDCAESSQTQ